MLTVTVIYWLQIATKRVACQRPDIERQNFDTEVYDLKKKADIDTVEKMLKRKIAALSLGWLSIQTWSNVRDIIWSAKAKKLIILLFVPVMNNVLAGNIVQ